jgi:DNA gyrase/topoisomerase IV subunit A
MVKKTPLTAFPGPSARPFVAIRLAEGDRLGWAGVTSGADDIWLFSRQGNVIRFSETEVRAVGMVAGGVQGMRLGDDEDRVIGMGIAAGDGQVLMMTDHGQAKRVELRQFPRQGRYGKGVIGWKSMGGVLSGAAIGSPEDRAVVHLARGAARSVRFDDAPRRSRHGGGKKLIDLGESDRVTSLSPARPRPVFLEKTATAEAAPRRAAVSKGKADKKARRLSSKARAAQKKAPKRQGRGTASLKAKPAAKAALKGRSARNSSRKGK